MAVNPDLRDLLDALSEEQVDYLIIGALENAHRLWRALRSFGAPLMDVGPEDFTKKDLVHQIGIEPNRIDILMDVAGVDFEQAWKGREQSTYSGVPANFIGKQELIEAKRAAGRPVSTTVQPGPGCPGPRPG